ncbi:ATP-binding cassette subfamily B protein [Paenibacillus endophyticus]|uniref:ATP-binding cassette subfamily B protein n=1 Tax=Paenibacillus endophyticus TaxID=1294268 RepID=A0A7W5GBM3_9BACL|nr:ABC transporter ATP-binding protein [Paenibacillus endophyticus]MBB3153956.1 ATP-binding cassette subfamily B protein [Paenibacillus endophyticus]
MSKKNKMKFSQYRMMLSRYLLPQKKALAGLALLLFSSIGLQLVNPQIIRYFIDTAQSDKTLQPLYYAAALFIGFSLIQQLVSVIATYVSENLAWRATNQLRGDLAEHCLRLDMSFHKSNTSGSIIERVDGDVNALANFFSSFIIHLAGNLLLMIGIILLLFRENIWIGLGMLLFVVFAMIVIQWIRKFAVPVWAKWRQINAEFYGYIGEHLEGTEDTRANGATGFVMNRFYSLLRRMLPLRRKAFLGFSAMWITTIIVFALGNAMAFAISASLWKAGAISIGTVYLIFYYTELLAKPIEKIRTQIEDLQKADASLLRIFELFDTAPKIADGPGAKLPEGPLSVELNEVTFGYDEFPTLQELNLQVKPGEVLGLLGRTGSGKTTLARLMLRFYDPQQGSIRLNGTDIRECKLAELRSRVALVTQNIEILQGTIRDNLTLYDESISDSDIVAVLRELGLRNWYDTLPDGLDTPLASGGASLSAGEAQLLAFARVFLTNPGLVILDEASSRLDPLTEFRMEQAITKLLSSRSCIIIAHRLATVQRADQIVILEQGRIIESGARVKLAADPSSTFSRMLAAGLEEVLA